MPALECILCWVAQLPNGWASAFAQLDIELDGSNSIFVCILELPPSSPSYRPHPPTVKNASNITRHNERRALLDQFQIKQSEIRKFASKVKHTGTAVAARNLQASDERIRLLEANEAARISSHLAMIAAVCELGGTAKLLKFYKQYSQIRDQLAQQDALPDSFNSDYFSGHKFMTLNKRVVHNVVSRHLL